MIVKHDTDYMEMNEIMRSITKLTTKMLDNFDKTFECETNDPKITNMFNKEQNIDLIMNYFKNII